MSTDDNLFNSQQDALEALYVTNCRILDMLYVLGLEKDKENTSKVIDLHATGGLIGSGTAFDPSHLL